jgi:hypothetical protein
MQNTDHKIFAAKDNLGYIFYLLQSAELVEQE